MKKRLKGLLAFWLCVIMLVGGSMTVLAKNYTNMIDDLPGNTILYAGDTITYNIPAGEFMFNNTSQGTNGTITIPGVAGDTYRFTYTESGGVYTSITLYRISGREETQKSSGVPCDHSMSYEIYRQATEETDGLWAYQCTKCEHIDHFLPISGMGAFFERAISGINEAKPNATVTIGTDKWMSFNKDVYDALADRPDVALTVNFRHQGKFYTVTIPAGTDMTSYLTEDGYCGFLYLMVLFNGTELNAE